MPDAWFRTPVSGPMDVPVKDHGDSFAPASTRLVHVPEGARPGDIIHFKVKVFPNRHPLMGEAKPPQQQHDAWRHKGFGKARDAHYGGR